MIRPLGRIHKIVVALDAPKQFYNYTHIKFQVSHKISSILLTIIKFSISHVNISIHQYNYLFLHFYKFNMRRMI